MNRGSGPQLVAGGAAAVSTLYGHGAHLRRRVPLQRDGQTLSGDRLASAVQRAVAGGWRQADWTRSVRQRRVPQFPLSR